MPENSISPAAVHQSAIVIDGHADTPQRILDDHFDLADPLTGGDFNLETARSGNLGAEFFAIWVEPERFQGRYAERSRALINAVKKQVAKHPADLILATSPDEIEQAHREQKLAILMCIEGGHAIENSMELLREYYALGARYMTLTWNNSNGWADSSGDLHDLNIEHTRDGLSDFGEQVVREMNRLGMMVDISHVSDKTFYRTLELSRAPVIASHSGTRAWCDAPRNLTDEMLRAVAHSGGEDSNGGVVMVNFYSAFVSQEFRNQLEEIRPEIDRRIRAYNDDAQSRGGPIDFKKIDGIRKAAVSHIARPPFSQVVDHIDHVAKVAGIDHVGLGSDFDGVWGQLPEGLETPAGLPHITAELMARGYSAEDCRKVLGGNLLRVFREVEEVAEGLQSAKM